MSLYVGFKTFDSKQKRESIDGRERSENPGSWIPYCPSLRDLKVQIGPQDEAYQRGRNEQREEKK